MALNVLIDGNPFKDIHLIPFRAFLPKFMVFGRKSFLEIYSSIIQNRKSKKISFIRSFYIVPD